MNAGHAVRAGLLDVALAAAARGWRVFPISPGRKKPPAVRDWEHRATTDPARIERAWHADPYNVGIACGPSGLVVLDLDRPKPGEVPPPAYREPGIGDGGDVLAVLCEANDQPLPVDTYAVRTGSGGTHLYFTVPPGITLRNTAKRLGWLIDTRAHGGYVVAAGSTVDHRPYTALVDEDPAPLPGWLSDRLTDPPPAPVTERPTSTTAVAGSPSAYAAAALRGELGRVLAAIEGTRNHTLKQRRVRPRPARRRRPPAPPARRGRAHPRRASHRPTGARVRRHDPLRTRLRWAHSPPAREP